MRAEAPDGRFAVADHEKSAMKALYGHVVQLERGRTRTHIHTHTQTSAQGHKKAEKRESPKEYHMHVTYQAADTHVHTPQLHLILRCPKFRFVERNTVRKR